MTETQQRLINVLTRGLRLKHIAITPETAIFGKEGLGLDSVDVLEIAVLVHKHFGVELNEESDDARLALATVGTLAEYIDAHKTDAGAP